MEIYEFFLFYDFISKYIFFHDCRRINYPLKVNYNFSNKSVILKFHNPGDALNCIL